MNKMLKTISVLFLLYFLPAISYSQYVLNGAATQNSCNCYTLTQAQFTQAGSVWNSNLIDLNNAFDFWFNVYLGCQDANGADGIVFILQPISTSIGGTGGGMGFTGIVPSIGITLDTWQNAEYNDPAFDHISIQANGNAAHGSDLSGPVPASVSSDNIEDCAWHVLRISWDPATKWLRSYFDGVLRVEAQVDLIATIFNNNPNVYWGFTAATGGANNLQQFCTALNPDFKTDAVNNAVCIGTPIKFTDNSISFAPIQSWYWDLGDGTTSTLKNPPSHLYSSPGIYEVKMVIRGLDGCLSDTLRKNITVGSVPVANFQIFDTCAGIAPQIIDQSTNNVGQLTEWTWLVDGQPPLITSLPVLTNLSAGPHTVRMFVKSAVGCVSDTVIRSFQVKPVPDVMINAQDGCIDKPVNFSGIQIDNQTTINSWQWDFGDGSIGIFQNMTHNYSQAGSQTVGLNVIASNGCVAIASIPINIVYVDVETIQDTTVLPNLPFPVVLSYWTNSASPISFSWSPPLSFNNPFSQSPIVSVSDDVMLIVTANSAEGCTAKDTVNVKVFKGSSVYVPTGFTPNGDGRNDFLHGLYIGIKKVDYFRIYNRWGQLIFSTNSLIEGWDGTINGVKQQTGTYIWMLRAEDIAGKVYEMNGTSTLIR